MALEFAHGAIQWLAADVATTVYTVSGLTFQPKALRFYMVGIQSSTDATSATVFQYTSLGFATSTTARRCIGSRSTDNSGNAECSSSAHNDAIALALAATGTANDGALDLNAINSDGFSAIVDIQTFQSHTVFWEAWGGSDITVAAVADFAEPAAIGDVDYTVTGFDSANNGDKVVMLGMVQSTVAINSGAGTDSGFCVGFATGAGAENVVLIGNSDDGSATMDTDGYGRGDECIGMIIVGGGTAVNSRASLTQFGTDNFRLNWAATANTSRKGIFMAIKGGRWRAGDYFIGGQVVGTTTTVSGLPFAPKGLCLMYQVRQESTSNSADASVHIGLGTGSSTSNRRSLGWHDVNGAATSDISTTVQYDQVLCSVDAGALSSAFDIDAMNSDGFRIICDLVDSVPNQWHGYLAFGDAPVRIAPIVQHSSAMWTGHTVV